LRTKTQPTLVTACGLAANGRWRAGGEPGRRQRGCYYFEAALCTALLDHEFHEIDRAVDHMFARRGRSDDIAPAISATAR